MRAVTNSVVLLLKSPVELPGPLRTQRKQRSGAIFARTVASVAATQACFAVRLSAECRRLSLQPLMRVLRIARLEIANVLLNGVRHPLS